MEKYLVLWRGGYLALEKHAEKNEELEVPEGAGVILWRPANEDSLRVEALQPHQTFHFQPRTEHCLIGTKICSFSSVRLIRLNGSGFHLHLRTETVTVTR